MRNKRYLHWRKGWIIDCFRRDRSTWLRRRESAPKGPSEVPPNTSAIFGTSRRPSSPDRWETTTDTLDPIAIAALICCNSQKGRCRPVWRSTIPEVCWIGVRRTVERTSRSECRRRRGGFLWMSPVWHNCYNWKEICYLKTFIKTNNEFLTLKFLTLFYRSLT